MGATKNIADWLEAATVADIGVTSCAKGNAAWARPAIGTSNAYIEWQSDEPGDSVRASKAVDTGTITFELVIVTTNEIALWALMDSARTMARSRSGKQTISSSAVTVRFGAWSRVVPSEDTIEALRYAASANVTFEL